MKMKKVMITAISATILTTGLSIINPTAHATGANPSHDKTPVKFGKYVKTYPKWLRGTWYYDSTSFGKNKMKFTNNTWFYYTDGHTLSSTNHLHVYTKGHDDKTSWNYAQLGNRKDLSKLFYINKKDLVKIPYASPVLVTNNFGSVQGSESILSVHKYGKNEVLTVQDGIDYSTIQNYYKTASIASHLKDKKYAGFRNS